MVNNTLDQFKNENLLPKITAEGLKIINPKTAKVLYYTQRNNPGRPVINSIICHTSEISRFVDYHSQALVKEIPSHIKDTIDFVNKINYCKVGGYPFLVSMDVKALHTNIPSNDVLLLLNESTTTTQRKP